MPCRELFTPPGVPRRAHAEQGPSTGKLSGKGAETRKIAIALENHRNIAHPVENCGKKFKVGFKEWMGMGIKVEPVFEHPSR